jgi:hypothetical protein
MEAPKEQLRIPQLNRISCMTVSDSLLMNIHIWVRIHHNLEGRLGEGLWSLNVPHHWRLRMGYPQELTGWK